MVSFGSERAIPSVKSMLLSFAIQVSQGIAKKICGFMIRREVIGKKLGKK
jgi:hypothetical protein